MTGVPPNGWLLIERDQRVSTWMRDKILNQRPLTARDTDSFIRTNHQDRRRGTQLFQSCTCYSMAFLVIQLYQR